MKNLSLILSCFILILAIACNDNAPKNQETASSSNDDIIQRGEYLVNILGCEDCHSPKVFGPNGPEVDVTKRFSGFQAGDKLGKIDTTVLKSWLLFNGTLTAFVGPWGVSYAANISSDATGIGDWKEEQFKLAIREGKFKGIASERSLLPPMPWQTFKTMKDDDLKAIFAYLKSTKPIHNIVPQVVSPQELASLK